MTNIRADSRGRASPERSPLEASRLSGSQKGQATILVLDDSATSAQLLQLYLERAGYHLTCPSFFDQSRLPLLGSIATQAAIALAKARLLEHAREEQGNLSAVLVADESGNLILANPAAELIDRILAQEAGFLEQRERRDVVVLFADLRGFMRMTIAHSAYAIIQVLNEFFTAMVDIVYAHRGTVFDLVGDELMVGFGAPFAQEDAPGRALCTAGEMQHCFAGLRRYGKERQGSEVGLGAGKDPGPVVMGNIGAPSRMNFGMVGNAVNTAHRLVELAQHGHILVSETVVESLGGELEGWTFERLAPTLLEGDGALVRVYLARME